MKKLKNIFTKAIKPAAGKLAYASMNEKFFRVKLLLARGADPNDRFNGNLTALCWATSNKKEKIVDFLLKKGADPSLACSDGWSPLHWAVIRDDIVITRLLLEAGADISARNNCRNTPLHLAMRRYNDKAEVIKKLLTEKETQAAQKIAGIAAEKEAERRRIEDSIATAAILKQDLPVGPPFRLKKPRKEL